MNDNFTNPLTLQEFIQAGKQLKKEGKLHEAIEQCTKALKINPNSTPVLTQLAEIYEDQNEFEKARNQYQHIIQLNPKNARSYAKLAKVQSKQNHILESIASYQKAINIKSEQPGWVYLEFGRTLQKNGNLLEAITAYQKSIEINPKNISAYRELSQVYSMSGQPDQAIATYRKVIELGGEHPDLLSKLEELGQEKECLERWKTLNQTTIDSIDEADEYKLHDIQLEVAKKYFKQTSQYKVIRLDALSKEDKLFLNNHNISLSHLQSIRKDYLVEQASLNYISENQQQEPEIDEKLTIPNFTAFHLSMLETGYISTICPISGQVLKSNQSFVPHQKIFIMYRFVSDEVFYLILNTNRMVNCLVYFPRIELIVKLKSGFAWNDSCIQNIINGFKGLAVNQYSSMLKYLNYQGEREISVISSIVNNLGHNLVNDVSGISVLVKKNKLLDKVNKFILGYNEYFGKLEEIFPEISVEKILRLQDQEKMMEVILENNYFALPIRSAFISENITQRIHQVSLKNCNSSVLSRIKEAKHNHFPLLWISLRFHRRSWKSKIQGISNIINKLSTDYPGLGVIFDGFNLTDCHKNRDEGYPSFVKIQIDKENAVVQQILSLLDKQSISIYNNIGSSMQESIIWANAVDLYIADMGAALTKVATLANKPGIGYSNTHYMKVHSTWFGSSHRENAIDITLVPANHIVNFEENSNMLENNFDCDWNIIYNEVIKLISRLNQED